MSACYRSNHESVTTVWEDSDRRYHETREAIAAFKKKYGAKSAGAIVTSGSDYRLVGIALPFDKPPKGGTDLWRWDRKAGAWVPLRKTKEGKAIGKEFDACRAGRLGDVPGIPTYVQTKVGLFNLQGPALFRQDGYVWACFSSVDHEDVVKSGWGDLDESMWEQVKRSELEAAREAMEAEHAS